MRVQSAPPIPQAQSRAACSTSWFAHGLAMHQNLSEAFTTIGEEVDANDDDEDEDDEDDNGRADEAVAKDGKVFDSFDDTEKPPS